MTFDTQHPPSPAIDSGDKIYRLAIFYLASRKCKFFYFTSMLFQPSSARRALIPTAPIVSHVNRLGLFVNARSHYARSLLCGLLFATKLEKK